MAEEEFASADAGASDTYPIRAGEVKKGGFVVIKGFPCKVIDYSTSKTGKHGHAKAKIVALDIFTQRKYEDICPTSHNMIAPNVKREEWSIIDINDEGFASLMNEAGDTREDLKIPPVEVKDDDDRYEAYQLIVEKFRSGEEVSVTVMSAMGTDMILTTSK
eukprot:TRINITY_DN8069_c0_g1_i1.p1 TRINITY_DN8069_c0_g1~~TRINITY_DN8069_c0_g1_i1.p1  ORF type:complete len:172 (+),score=55.74 TRINITY_DN8069_c0_g1_i1:36-518(+)